MAQTSTPAAQIEREDIDFMAEKSAAAMQGSPEYAHFVLWTAFALVIAFLIWAAFANIGETTVGEGKVIPSSKAQLIQAAEPATIHQVLPSPSSRPAARSSARSAPG